MKSVKLNPLTSLVVAAALAIGLAGCGSSSNTPEAVVETPPDPGPTEQETAQSDAAAAAMAAKSAADAADADAAAAEAATANLATMQTRAMASTEAMKARAEAEAAMEAYMDAKAASEAAEAAAGTTAAARALVMAEAAQERAEAAAMKAGDYSDMAIASAMMELKIDGTMKSVGDTSIDADAPKTEVTRGSGDSAEKTIMGLVSSVMTTGGETDARAGRPAVLSTGTKYQALRVGAAERSGENALAIGKNVDSEDDMSRLALVTAYAGTQTVNVYFSDGTVAQRSNKAGTIVTGSDGTTAVADGGDFAADGNLTHPLRPVGMFYRSGTVASAPSATVDTTSGLTGVPADTYDVAAAAKARQVYAFGPAATPTYVVLNNTETTEVAGGDDTQVYSYEVVTIHVALDADGLASTPPADGNTAENVYVTADIPAPVDYQHLHFGVWASLGDASKDGSQDITGLGIGFVQDIDGGGMTADMPITGDATYKGNWVATVESSVGDFALEDGTATVTADFGESEITATLTGLATLEGTITGSSFSGEKATVGANTLGLTGSTFDGSFSGGFYGAKAVEAAGVFDYSSNSGGAFRGAFGGYTDDTTE